MSTACCPALLDRRGVFADESSISPRGCASAQSGAACAAPSPRFGDTFARDGEQLADLFEGAVGLQADAEAHPQDLLFAWRQRCQDLARHLAEIAPDRRLDRPTGKDCGRKQSGE
jgi:hypothetical protein